MGHLNSFSVSRGRNLTKKFQNSHARGVARGVCLSFDLTGTSFVIVAVSMKSRLFSFVALEDEGSELSQSNPFSRIKNSISEKNYL